MDQVERQTAPINPTKPKSPITILRDYLTSLTPEIIDRLSQIDELAMRAKIIAEHMRENAIEDVNEGIRSFTAFERSRLQQLGFLVHRDGRATKANAVMPALAAIGQQS